MSTLGYAPKRKLRFCQPLSTFVNADNLYNTLNNSLVPIVNAVIAHMPVFCMTMHRQKNSRAAHTSATRKQEQLINYYAIFRERAYCPHFQPLLLTQD